MPKNMPQEQHLTPQCWATVCADPIDREFKVLLHCRCQCITYTWVFEQISAVPASWQWPCTVPACSPWCRARVCEGVGVGMFHLTFAVGFNHYLCASFSLLRVWVLFTQGPCMFLPVIQCYPIMAMLPLINQGVRRDTDWPIWPTRALKQCTLAKCGAFCVVWVGLFGASHTCMFSIILGVTSLIQLHGIIVSDSCSSACLMPSRSSFNMNNCLLYQHAFGNICISILMYVYRESPVLSCALTVL